MLVFMTRFVNKTNIAKGCQRLITVQKGQQTQKWVQKNGKYMNFKGLLMTLSFQTH